MQFVFRSLCTLAGITASSALKFFGGGAADLPRALALGAPAVLCAPLGAVVAGRVTGRTLKLAFNTLTVVVMPAQACYFTWKMLQPVPAGQVRTLWIDRANKGDG